MNDRCLTREQAEMICYQYQYLVGQPFLKEQQGISSIEHVLVSPFDNLNKWLFIYHFEDNYDPDGALSFYESAEYDVIVVSKVKGEITFRDIRNHLATNNMSPDPLYFYKEQQIHPRANGLPYTMNGGNPNSFRSHGPR